MDSWSGAQWQNLSIVIYHTLFSHNEERFHQTGFKREKKREKREVFTEDKWIFLILKKQYMYRYKLYIAVMYTVMIQTFLSLKKFW